VWVLRIYTTLLVLVTLLPFIPSGKWHFRVWDFPRLQIFGLLLIPIAWLCITAGLSGLSTESTFWLVVCFVTIAWQALHFLPFSPVWPKEIKGSQSKPEITLLISNLDYTNQEMTEAQEKLLSVPCDILLLIEVTDKWIENLQSLRSKFKFHFEQCRGEGLGLAIWTNLECEKTKARYLVSNRRVSLWTTLHLETNRVVNFVGVHPTPPALKDSTGEERRDSRVRDAELVLVANEVAKKSDQTWIVAGDFNDVAWSHTTRLFKRLSGLKDPRVGRKFMGTFVAQYPLLRCPIDHVFMSKEFEINKLDRVFVPGSDHLGLLTALSIKPTETGNEPKPEGDDVQEAKDLVQEGFQDAQQRGVAAVAPSAVKSFPDV
jgi:endonuclease/exonuclease/phosphatase (EEP) superfamily protein YafD